MLEKLKQGLRALGGTVRAAALGVVVAIGSAGAVVEQAHAAVPASVATTFTEMQSDFAEVFGYAFTVMGVIVLAMIAWRYTKKLGNKL